MAFLHNLFEKKHAGGTAIEEQPRVGASAPAKTPTSLVARAQSLLKAKNVEGLRELAGSADNAVTDVFVDALRDPDPQVRIMAIDSLGLTSDPRAAGALVEVFKDSVGFPREIAALSLANLVANRVESREAIPSLMSIVRDRSLKVLIRAQAVMALCRFRGPDGEVTQFLDQIREDPDEDLEIRLAATDLTTGRTQS